MFQNVFVFLYTSYSYSAVWCLALVFKSCVLLIFNWNHFKLQGCKLKRLLYTIILFFLLLYTFLVFGVESSFLFVINLPKTVNYVTVYLSIFLRINLEFIYLFIFKISFTFYVQFGTELRCSNLVFTISIFTT